MDSLVALSSARSEFERRLRQVDAGAWDRPTPCSDWNVRDLVLHVLGGLAMAAALLDGCPREEAAAHFEGASVPDDFAAAFHRLAPRPPEPSAAPGAW